ncbi:unconventional prefoldin RPB5 interactor [Haematobia irritans]|uniref:unconventional prefoldin RPB5 interactor n=1 Tax=Haematobia irritans TaxID=7368 RepID=UPI003F5076B8
MKDLFGKFCFPGLLFTTCAASRGTSKLHWTMDKREHALKEALQNNAEETERWRSYLKENESAKENILMFQKRLSVEVMVPVGKKALMPGRLIHTNEVLVGHYQGYFSKCSAFKAEEICDLRIKTAREHLKKLETELELWQNKLEKPYVEGVVPSGEEREIIEEYNEEQEKIWKEKHQIRLKEAKLKEKEQREKEVREETKKAMAEENPKEKSDEDIFKMLEEAEIMEELEEELQSLEVDEVNDETIRKLMSGEMYLPPEKKRVAHNILQKEKENEENLLQTNIVKKSTIQEKVITTNNNSMPNPYFDQNNNSGDEDNDEEPLPEEVRIIKEQAKFLSNEDQIGFYEYQIEIIRQKIRALPLSNQEEMEEKIRLLTVLEHMEDLLDFAETAVGNEELAEQDEQEEKNESEKKLNTEIEKSMEAKEENKQPKNTQKRRISFASEDQTLEFCKNEAVTQMLFDKKEVSKRDIIKLDDDQLAKRNENYVIPTSAPKVDKKDLIKAKVEQSLQYVSENQSKQDFDLVNKILDTSMGKINTLHILFKHSSQCPVEYPTTEDNKNCDIPGTPADFYSAYLKSIESSKDSEPTTLFINSYEGEDQVRTPALKESDRQQAYKDPKAEFSNPKSILRNKDAIEMENRNLQYKPENGDKKTKKQKKKRTPKEEEEITSAYYKVMNEVVEKPLTEPEPLPDVKFIDAHAPKRRVSRFKQMRQGSEAT